MSGRWARRSMDRIFLAALLSLSTNIDNFAVGMSCGVQQQTIRFSANLLIALLSAVGTYLSMQLGDWMNGFLSPTVADKLGSGLLIVMGLYAIAEVLKMRATSVNDETIVLVQSSTRQAMGMKEAIALGLVLTISNFGTGIGAGIADFDLGLASCCSFLSSLVAIGGGTLLGKMVTQNFSRDRLELMTGMLLMGLGIYQVL
ncbi:MAG: manganese efflux pump [Spirulina sp.]